MFFMLYNMTCTYMKTDAIIFCVVLVYLICFRCLLVLWEVGLPKSITDNIIVCVCASVS